MGAELDRFFYDQEVTNERMGKYGSALRFHANKAVGYASKYPQVAGMIGMGFPFYLPKDIPQELQIPEVTRFVQVAKDNVSPVTLQEWSCPSCFSENDLAGTRNNTCKSCGIETFKPSDLQKIYMDLDMLCLIDGDDATFKETAKNIALDMRTGFSPSLDFDLASSLDQYSSFVADPFKTPPPMDLHFVKTDDFLRTVASIHEGMPTELPVLSAYEELKESNLPFSIGGLFLSEPVLANTAVRQSLNEKREEFVKNSSDAIHVLDGIKARSGQVRRMFAPPNLEAMLLEKMAQPYEASSKAILVFGTGVDDKDSLGPDSLTDSEGLWRVHAAVDLAGGTEFPILFTGFESDDMALAAVRIDPSLGPYIFTEPYSASTEENIQNIVFFEDKLINSPRDWIGVSNRWHLERIRWGISAHPSGIQMEMVPIEQTMAVHGIDAQSIDRFQYRRYVSEASKIKQITGYIPPFR